MIWTRVDMTGSVWFVVMKEMFILAIMVVTGLGWSIPDSDDLPAYTTFSFNAITGFDSDR